jgi:UDP-N-acetylmuramate--alanine ligase
MSMSGMIETRTGKTRVDELRSVYFIGIGGIGMSAIARYFYSKGARVSGYDKTPTDLTRELEASGMSIHYKEDVNAIPKDADLVVYTPAVPADHAELIYFREHSYNVVKRSDVLGMISATSFNICIGGTHGKTTITTMTAHILRHSGYGSTAFLGGISVNYNTNFWSSKMDVCVIEADEYDRSFLKLSPNIAVITAMDADHLDIYGDEQSMQDAFVAFGNKVRKDGLLVSRFGLKRIKEVEVKRKLSYSLQNNAADIFAQDITIEEGGYRYSAVVNGEVLSNLELRIGGMHNVENSLVAIAIAIEMGIAPDKISEAVAAFKGVKRRFEYIIPPQRQQAGGYVMPVLVDDYAHHPEELKALLTSVRSLFPQRIVTVVFQPHLFTRTRDLADGFASALSLANRAILLPIYPARETPLEGITSGLILDKIEGSDAMLLSKEEMLDWMKTHMKDLDKEFGEVIVMAGAGDIDVLVQPVKEIIQGKK